MSIWDNLFGKKSVELPQNEVPVRTSPEDWTPKELAQHLLAHPEKLGEAIGLREYNNPHTEALRLKIQENWGNDEKNLSQETGKLCAEVIRMPDPGPDTSPASFLRQLESEYLKQSVTNAEQKQKLEEGVSFRERNPQLFEAHDRYLDVKFKASVGGEGSNGLDKQGPAHKRTQAALVPGVGQHANALEDRPMEKPAQNAANAINDKNKHLYARELWPQNLQKEEAQKQVESGQSLKR